MLEVREETIKERRKLHRLSPSITSISLFLSLNLSALLQDLKRNKNTKERRRTPTLHYTNGGENLTITLRIPISGPLQGFI